MSFHPFFPPRPILFCAEPAVQVVARPPTTAIVPLSASKRQNGVVLAAAEHALIHDATPDGIVCHP